MYVRPAGDSRTAPTGAARYQQSEAEAVALPKNLDFVSLEVYGTLIDWETGIYDAFQRRPPRTASRSIATS